MKYEVHQHCWIAGPKANRSDLYKFEHSHAGGSEPHKHADTGPASYTIDKDEWFATTGLQGGGRKKFTAEPSGLQLDPVELEDWQKSFRIVVGPPPANHSGEGGGLATAARMVLGSRMEIEP